MIPFALALIALPIVLFVYAYAGYPALLKVFGWFRPPVRRPGDPDEWPSITITLPAYNEEAAIAGALDSLLRLDYPADRRHILVISDCSSDRTDEIVQGYADRGVQLLRLPRRSGKTAAENAAAPHLRGEIVVNTDATIRIKPKALKALIRVFQDPTVGVASGRDVSVGDVAHEDSRGESGYVGYEMWVRGLETRVGGIIGASGCFFATRKELHDTLFPEALSRDFASALIAREHGFRAVSVEDAVCLVPRTASLQREYRRKIRTMARGLDTLYYKRHLLNPFRYGWFALKLLSHKLCRWLVPLTFPLAGVGLVLLAVAYPPLWALVLVAAVATILGLLATRWSETRSLPGPLATFAFLFSSNLAGLMAWAKALRGERNPIWEPTRRTV